MAEGVVYNIIFSKLVLLLYLNLHFVVINSDHLTPRLRVNISAMPYTYAPDLNNSSTFAVNAIEEVLMLVIISPTFKSFAVFI